MKEVVWEDFKYPGSRMIKSVFKKFANNGKSIKYELEETGNSYKSEGRDYRLAKRLRKGADFRGI